MDQSPHQRKGEVEATIDDARHEYYRVYGHEPFHSTEQMAESIRAHKFDYKDFLSAESRDRAAREALRARAEEEAMDRDREAQVQEERLALALRRVMERGEVADYSFVPDELKGLPRWRIEARMATHDDLLTLTHALLLEEVDESLARIAHECVEEMQDEEIQGIEEMIRTNYPILAGLSSEELRDRLNEIGRSTDTHGLTGAQRKRALIRRMHQEVVDHFNHTHGINMPTRPWEQLMSGEADAAPLLPPRRQPAGINSRCTGATPEWFKQPHQTQVSGAEPLFMTEADIQSMTLSGIRDALMSMGLDAATPGLRVLHEQRSDS